MQSEINSSEKQEARGFLSTGMSQWKSTEGLLVED